MRVALVHDWLVAHRGGELVLLALAEMFPQAPIYTLVYDPARVHPKLKQRVVHTSMIQKLPGAPERFRGYLPLFPRAVERLPLARTDHDVIISTSHCVAKGVMTRPDQVHVSYVHTPMRYLWDQMPQYTPAALRWLLPVLRAAVAPLRRWDVRSAQRPQVLLANSAYVAARMMRVWGREAQVIYPPVDVDFYAAPPNEADGAACESDGAHSVAASDRVWQGGTGAKTARGAADATADTPPMRDGYLVVGALVPYKRVELAIQAANEAELALTVVGNGPEAGRLRRLAGPTVHFLPNVDRHRLRRLYRRARGLLFCGVEDFGIVPVEAIAAGCPVVARSRGGAAETVRHGHSGVHFDEPTVAAVLEAVQALEHLRTQRAFKQTAMAAYAARFSTQRFVSQMQSVVQEAWLQQHDSAKGRIDAAA